MLIDFFRDRGRKGQKEGEKYQCEKEILTSCFPHALQTGSKPTTQAWALTGSLTCRLLVYGTMLKKTEPYQPGQD